MAITDRFRPMNCAPLRVKNRAVPGFFCLPCGRQKGDSWPKFEWNGPIVDALYSVQSNLQALFSPVLSRTTSHGTLAPYQAHQAHQEPHTRVQAKVRTVDKSLWNVSRMKRRLWGIPISERRSHLLEGFQASTSTGQRTHNIRGEAPAARWRVLPKTALPFAFCPLPEMRVWYPVLLEKREKLGRSSAVDRGMPRARCTQQQALCMSTPSRFWKSGCSPACASYTSLCACLCDWACRHKAYRAVA
ncbi:hypothetical protein V8C44DRAFT_40245 [Trichoderma aethiopicum]